MKYTFENRYRETSCIELYRKLESYLNQNNLYFKYTTQRSIPEANDICWSSGGIIGAPHGSELKIFQLSDGKGADQYEARISSAMESYEKFCSAYSFVINPFFFYRYKLYKKGHYVFDENEKLINFDDIRMDNNINEFLKNNFNNVQQQRSYINLINNDRLIGVPYQSLKNDEIKYYNPNALYHVNKDMGFGAGNTITEALMHGISEIYIKHIAYQIFNNYKEQKFYYIPTHILPLEIKNMISKIETRNNKIFIFDLSYNYGLPVVLALTYSRTCTRLHFAFGSSIFFYEAIKNAIFELYHGIYHNGIIDQHQIPYREIPENYNEILPYLGAKEAQFMYTLPIQVVKYRHIIPEEILFNSEIIDDYNKLIFMEENNCDDLTAALSKQINSIPYNIYYHDYSLFDDIKTVHVYIPDLITRNNASYYINTLGEEYKEKNIKLVFQLYATIFNIINEQQVDLNEICDLILQIDQEKDKIMLDDLMGTDWLSMRVRENSSILFFLQDLFNQKPINLTFIQDIYSKYDILYYNSLIQYCKTEKYTKDELEKFFYLININNKNRSYDIVNDINNFEKNGYLFQQTVIIPLIEEFNNPKSIFRDYLKKRLDYELQ